MSSESLDIFRIFWTIQSGIKWHQKVLISVLRSMQIGKGVDCPDYENHSRKQPAPVTDTFFALRGCPVTTAWTVVSIALSLARNWEIFGVYNLLGKLQTKMLVCQACVTLAFILFSQHLDWFRNPHTSQRTAVSYQHQKYLGRQALCWTQWNRGVHRVWKACRNCRG